MHKQPTANENQGFHWPPRDPAGPLVDPVPTRRPASSPIVPPLHWWECIERAWLSVRTAPLKRRFMDEGWVPDHAAAYCPRCGDSVGPFEADLSGCPACRARRLPWERAIRLGAHEGILREAILDLKFHAWRRVGDELGCLLGQAVKNALLNATIPLESVTVIPVPTTMFRRLGHGVDHALVLARGVARELDAPIRRPVWRRRGPAQRGASATERRYRIAGAFRPREWGGYPQLAGRTIVIVDDVRTTGATLRGVCRALKSGMRRWEKRSGKRPAPLRVIVATIAVTPIRENRRVNQGITRA